MRIKKIAPTTPPSGLLTTTYGTSETDGYAQSYQNEHNVVVSPTTPTTNERVWFRYSENIFDETAETKNSYINGTVGSEITYPSSSASISYVKCATLTSNKTYIIDAYISGTPQSTGSRQYCLIDSNNIVLESYVIGSTKSGHNELIISTSYSGYLSIAVDKNITSVTIKEYIAPSINVNGEEIYNQNVMNYSTTEQVVGKWIDGKPLYRKVYTGTTSSGDGFVNLDTDISMFLLKNATFPSLNYRDFTYYLDTTNNRAGLDIAITNTTTGLLQYRVLNTTLRSQSYIFVLEYTKTTD